MIGVGVHKLRHLWSKTHPGSDLVRTRARLFRRAYACAGTGCGEQARVKDVAGA